MSYKIQKYRCSLVRDGVIKATVDKIQDPNAAAELIRGYLGPNPDREHFVAVMLSASDGVIGVNTISIGTLTASLVHPREVFKPAILANAAAIIVAHNHPSGDPTPSPEDKATTRRLVDAGRTLGIPVLDHIVIGGPGRYFSFRDRGLLD